MIFHKAKYMLNFNKTLRRSLLALICLHSSLNLHLIKGSSKAFKSQTTTAFHFNFICLSVKYVFYTKFGKQLIIFLKKMTKIGTEIFSIYYTKMFKCLKHRKNDESKADLIKIGY